MNQNISNIFSLLANFAAILTAIIATVFYYKSKSKSYFKNDITGNYKIFSSLKDQENSEALIHIEIKYVSSRGSFFGLIKYQETSKSPGTGSAGFANIYGILDYSYFRIICKVLTRFLYRKRFNPLEVNNSTSFNGTIYLLSRNDLDISTRNWKEMLIQEYSITHFKDAQRIKFFNPKTENSYLQLPNEFTLVNIDKIPDPMFNRKMSF